MWHTAEMVKIFEKMTEGYGYDIYQNRKLCVALCNGFLSNLVRRVNDFDGL